MDIAYHRNKFEVRGFDRVIDVLGADHHGHALRFKAGIKALGIDNSRLDFIIMQLVQLLQDGKEVKVSTRSGKSITLSDLLDEISVAAAVLLHSKPTTPDLRPGPGGAPGQRKHRVLRAVRPSPHLLPRLRLARGRANRVPKASDISPAMLAADEEKFPGEEPGPAAGGDPPVLPGTTDPPASIVTSSPWRGISPVLQFLPHQGEADDVLYARLKQADAVRSVIANCLKLIGVSAPEKM